jgi:hypothetical protein
VSRIVGIGLSGKNGSKGTKKQENGKEYEKISKSGPENRREYGRSAAQKNLGPAARKE